LLQYGDKSLGIEASAEAGNDLDVGFAIVGLLLCCVCCVQVRLSAATGVYHPAQAVVEDSVFDVVAFGGGCG